MSLWTDRLDLEGQPHTSVHRDGHKLGLAFGEWWAYHRDYCYQPPGSPKIGPAPRGPFYTLDEAKHAVEAQGFPSTFDFGDTECSSAAPSTASTASAASPSRSACRPSFTPG